MKDNPAHEAPTTSPAPKKMKKEGFTPAVEANATVETGAGQEISLTDSTRAAFGMDTAMASASSAPGLLTESTENLLKGLAQEGTYPITPALDISMGSITEARLSQMDHEVAAKVGIWPAAGTGAPAPPGSVAAAGGLPFRTPTTTGDLYTGSGRDKSVEVLERANGTLGHVKEQLKTIGWEQRKAVLPFAPESYHSLVKAQQSLAVEMTATINEMDDQMSRQLLRPEVAWKMKQLKYEIQVWLKQLQLYQQELRAIYKKEPNQAVAALVITKQPFPMTVKQHVKSHASGIEEPVIVQLLIGARTDVKPMSAVVASLTFEEYQSTRKTKLIVQNEQQKLEKRLAKFTDLRFPSGTRLKMVRVRFTCQVQSHSGTVVAPVSTMESNSSEPFIVMTNENQWSDCAYTLLRKDVFSGATSPNVPWHLFANKLQLHYLRSTRQDHAKPQRPLSRSDFAYIQTKQFAYAKSKGYVTEPEFKKFWDWFGKGLHKIRHQKPLSNLWFKGYIMGFLTKDQSSLLLLDPKIKARQGTFLIRFSEQRPGQFAIAYLKEDSTGARSVKHYLVKPDDIAPPTKTLPDFLHGKEVFTEVMRIRPEFENENPVLQVFPKDDAFQEYYSKKNFSTPDGYDDIDP